MNTAQILFLLISSVLFFSLLRFQSQYTLRVYEKFILISFFILSIILIINPTLLDILARSLLIARGSDLLFYFYILFSLWGVLKCHFRLNKINSKLNKIISEMAIKDVLKSN